MVFERVANELRGGVSGLPPMELDEAVKLDSGGVLMYLGTAPQDQGEGRLVITTRFAAACKGASPIPNLAKVVWLSSADASRAYMVDFPSISLHAISRDLSSFPKPCIYCQFDGDVAGDSGEAAQVVEEQAGDEPMPLSTEARFVVSEGGAEPLEAIFSTLSECALLNPDDDDDDDDDDGGDMEGGFFGGADAGEAALGTAEGNLAHYERLLEQSEAQALPTDAVAMMSLAADEARGMFDDAD